MCPISSRNSRGTQASTRGDSVTLSLTQKTQGQIFNPCGIRIMLRSGALDGLGLQSGLSVVWGFVKSDHAVPPVLPRLNLLLTKDLQVKADWS